MIAEYNKKAAYYNRIRKIYDSFDFSANKNNTRRVKFVNSLLDVMSELKPTLDELEVDVVWEKYGSLSNLNRYKEYYILY